MDRTCGGVGGRLVKDRVFMGLVLFFAAASTLPLLFILGYLMKKGISSINWGFIVNLPKPPGEPGGGIANAIVGTLILIGISSVLSVPPGVAVGVFLSEFKKSKLSYWVRLGIEILQGVPSIVLGIVAYVWVVKPMGGFSALSGGVALAIMMMPVVAKATEETLKLIPPTIKEASYALGVPYHRTLLKVVIPAGLTGIITGVVIGIARIAGETAPLLFTAFGSPYMNLNILKPMDALPLLIFNYASSPYKDWHTMAWGASFILIVMVLILNILARGVSRRWKVKF